jgi:hypothetical protein
MRGPKENPRLREGRHGQDYQSCRSLREDKASVPVPIFEATSLRVARIRGQPARHSLPEFQTTGRSRDDEYNYDFAFSSADGGGRTHTTLRSLDFESSASANSATSAYLQGRMVDRF